MQSHLSSQVIRTSAIAHRCRLVGFRRRPFTGCTSFVAALPHQVQQAIRAVQVVEAYHPAKAIGDLDEDCSFYEAFTILPTDSLIHELQHLPILLSHRDHPCCLLSRAPEQGLSLTRRRCFVAFREGVSSYVVVL